MLADPGSRPAGSTRNVPPPRRGALRPIPLLLIEPSRPIGRSGSCSPATSLCANTRQDTGAGSQPPDTGDAFGGGGSPTNRGRGCTTAAGGAERAQLGKSVAQGRSGNLRTRSNSRSGTGSSSLQHPGSRSRRRGRTYPLLGSRSACHRVRSPDDVLCSRDRLAGRNSRRHRLSR